MTDHQHLRELAQQATPGPWQSDRRRGAVETAYTTSVIGTEDIAYDMCDADAEFIAAANPTAVLALLDELEDTRAAYQLTRHQLDAHRAGQGTWVHRELGGHTEVIHDTAEGITR